MKERKIKKALTALLTVCLILVPGFLGAVQTTYATAGSWSDYIASGYAGGDGTSGNPYRIATAEQLAYFAAQVNGGNNYLGKYLILTGSLDLTDHYWTAIGTENKPFFGSFNGNKNVVSNVIINTSTNYLGLFGISSGTITTLGIANCNIYGSGATFIGGFIGVNNGTITNCYVAAGSASGTYTVGGFVGDNNGTITNCYANVNVTRNGSTNGTQFGGFAGNNDGYASVAKLLNCFAAGSVSVDAMSGGLVGYASKQSNSNCQITNCYYVFATYGTNGIGYDGGSYTTTRTYLYILQTKAFYITSLPTWDLSNIWALNPDVNNGLPNFGSWAALPFPGAGTSESPYLIASASDLQWIQANNTVNYGFGGQYFTQTADISLSGQWTPIGTNTIPFKGTFNGGGKVISGLTITGSSASGLGLFGYTNSAAVLSNINLTVVKISTTGTSAGGLVGECSGSTITGCSVSVSTGGTIGGGSYSGGIIGYGYGTLQKCSVSGSVSGIGTGGGLIGFASSTTNIINCYTTSSVTSATISGGLVGQVNGNTTIKNSYATGFISGSGTGTYGGLVGSRNTSYSLSLYNNFFAGGMGDSKWGGIVGNNSVTTVSYCYYTYTSAGGTLGIQTGGTDFFKNKGNYTSTSIWNSSYPWDFSAVWALDPNINNGFPFLGTAALLPVSGGSGTSTDPYLIATAEDLAVMGTYNMAQGGFSGVYFKQTANIALSGQWTPIGNVSAMFKGNYDGGGKTISGLTITGSSATNLGLFGYAGGSLSNINLTGVNISTTGTYAGGLAGQIGGGTITGCSVSGSIGSGNSGSAGGIFGYGGNCTLQKCSVSGSVSSSTGGGLVGTAVYPVSTKDCYTTANVYGVTNSGGLVGAVYQTTSIFNSYASGNVTTSGSGGSYGGLVGLRHPSYNLYIINSFFAGYMGNYLWGGIVGSNSATNVDHCYYQENFAKGSYGTAKPITFFKTASTYSTASNWNTSYLWNFTNVWSINASVNNGLPYLQSSSADLSGLVLSTGTLSPAFSSEVTSYTSVVANSVSSFTVTPTVFDSKAAVKVNGVTVTSGSTSESIALTEGTNSITVEVTAENGTLKTYTITVTRDAVVSVTSVSLDKTALTMYTFESVSLTASIEPDNALDKTVLWSSSNEGVAIVDNTGIVTALSAGTATITVTTNGGGKTAQCAVTVEEQKVDVTIYGTNQLKVNIHGWNENYKYQIWSYQKIASDIFDSIENKANQWILSKEYKLGSAADFHESDGSISFIIDKPALAPDENFNISVKVQDGNGSYIGQLKDTYTPEDIGLVKISKVLVDHNYSSGKEVKEIKADAVVSFEIFGVNANNYSAKVNETEIVSPSSNNTFTWDIADKKPGTYKVVLTAKNIDTQSADSKTIIFQLYSSETGINYAVINSMPISARTVGGNFEIELNPQIENGNEFYYSIGEPGRSPLFTSEYLPVGSYFKKSIEASKYGIYQLFAYVKRTGITSYDDGIFKTVINKRSGNVLMDFLVDGTNISNSQTLTRLKGTSMQFSANATIASHSEGQIQYSYWRYDAKGWILIKDWSNSDTLDWTPARAGQYIIQVRAKGTEAGSYEIEKSVTVNVSTNEIAQGVNISINEAELSGAKARTPIVIKANATAANSENLLYKFYVNDSFLGTATLQNYSASQACTWIPRKPGTYTISVLVKSSESYGRYDAIQSFTVVVE